LKRNNYFINWIRKLRWGLYLPDTQHNNSPISRCNSMIEMFYCLFNIGGNIIQVTRVTWLLLHLKFILIFQFRIVSNSFWKFLTTFFSKNVITTMKLPNYEFALFWAIVFTCPMK
jgi:hypothetical protein